MFGVTDITFFGHDFLPATAFVEKFVSLSMKWKQFSSEMGAQVLFKL